MDKDRWLNAPSPDKTLQEVAQLLNTLPGTRVLKGQANPAGLRIEFTVESWASLLLLEHCAAAANVPLHSWARHGPRSEQALKNPATAIVHRYHARSDPHGPEHAAESFEHLGAFLVWEMEALGHLSEQESVRLLQLWNAGPNPHR